jgi:hypothetical protein
MNLVEHIKSSESISFSSKSVAIINENSSKNPEILITSEGDLRMAFPTTSRFNSFKRVTAHSARFLPKSSPAMKKFASISLSVTLSASTTVKERILGRMLN